MKYKQALQLLLVCSFSSAALADFTGDIYERGSNKTKKLFTVKNQMTESDGLTNSTTTYADLTGATAVEEKSVLKGKEFIKIELTQKQMDAKATIEIKDGKALFTKTEDGKTKTSEEKLKGEFVITANFQRFVQSKWDLINKGEEIEFRFGSWERMETVGFEIKKIAAEKFEGQDVVTIRMKASNFIIARIVDPITFHFKPDGSKIIHSIGRVAPKQKKGNSWKDLDAELFYQHP